jgi:putative transposase
MQRFKTAAAFPKFTSYNAQIYNHFNHERHLKNRQSFKQKFATALAEWFNFCAE